MPKPINFSLLLNHLKFMVMVVLTHLGLFNTAQHQEADSYEQHPPTSYDVLLGWPTQSLVPVPAQILISNIKKKLPVVEYSELLEKSSTGGDEKNMMCTVCLSCIERSHEIRDLSNCSHVFHRECLDNWLDVGQVTCPLCRSMLFPATGENCSLVW